MWLVASMVRRWFIVWEYSQVECCVHRKEDYRGWIAYQKRKWRAKTAQRKKRKLDASKRRTVEEAEPQRPAGDPQAMHLRPPFLRAWDIGSNQPEPQRDSRCPAYG